MKGLSTTFILASISHILGSSVHGDPEKDARSRGPGAKDELHRKWDFEVGRLETSSLRDHGENFPSLDCPIDLPR